MAMFKSTAAQLPDLYKKLCNSYVAAYPDKSKKDQLCEAQVLNLCLI